MVQWLRLCAFNAGSTGSIPGWGTKIPYTAWGSQKTQNRDTWDFLDNAGQGTHKGGNYIPDSVWAQPRKLKIFCYKIQKKKLEVEVKSRDRKWEIMSIKTSFYRAYKE